MRILLSYLYIIAIFKGLKEMDIVSGVIVAILLLLASWIIYRATKKN